MILLPLNDEEETIDSLYDWLNDSKMISQATGYYEPKNRVQVIDWIVEQTGKDDQVIFGIWHINELVGYITLSQISHRNGSAVLGIVIGTHQNKGIGTQAILQMLKYAWTQLNIRSVVLGVYEGNDIAMHVYQKCGFLEVGRYPTYYYKDGAWVDLIMMMTRRPYD